MKFARTVVLTSVFSLLLPLSLLAKDHSAKQSINLQIFQPAAVAGTTLAPGQYKVEWTGTGPAVNAEFKLNGKTVATAPATVSELTKSSQPNATVMQKEADGTQAITEIDGKKQVLKFGTEAPTGNQGAAQ
jgi:hypothetical protein